MKRIIVTVENEVGVLADITQVLAREDINLASINTEGRGDSGLVILTTEECDRALHALMNAGYRAVTDDALIIKLRDEPGALAKGSGALQRCRREHPKPPSPESSWRLRDSRS